MNIAVKVTQYNLYCKLQPEWIFPFASDVKLSWKNRLVSWKLVSVGELGYKKLTEESPFIRKLVS